MQPLFRGAMAIGLIAGLPAGVLARAQAPQESTPGAGVAQDSENAKTANTADASQEKGDASGDRKLGRSLETISRESIARTIDSLGFQALLRKEPVRRELGLSTKQVERVRQIIYQERARFEEYAKLNVELAEKETERVLKQGGTHGPKLFDPEVAREQEATRRREVDQMLRSTLTRSQVKRLEQIAIQARGPLAVVTDPEVMTWLGVLPAQKMKAAWVLRELERRKQQIDSEQTELWSVVLKNRASGVKSRAAPAGAKAEIWERFGVTKDIHLKHLENQAREEAAEQEAIRAIGEILTEPQKRRYRMLVGKPFDFTLLLEPPRPEAGERDEQRPTEEESSASPASPTPEAAQASAAPEPSI